MHACMDSRVTMDLKIPAGGYLLPTPTKIYSHSIIVCISPHNPCSSNAYKFPLPPTPPSHPTVQSPLTLPRAMASPPLQLFGFEESVKSCSRDLLDLARVPRSHQVLHSPSNRTTQAVTSNYHSPGFHRERGGGGLGSGGWPSDLSPPPLESLSPPPPPRIWRNYSNMRVN